MSKARTLADAVAAGGALRLAELATNGTNTVGLSAPNALAADVTWKLPSADGTAGQALLTDGAGNLSWGAGGGGSAISVSDEGSLLTSGVTSFNFTGAGVTATAVGNAVTVNAPPDFTWQAVQTTGFTAVAGRAYPCNTTSAAFTVTLPASPSPGDQVLITDYAGTWNTKPITISPAGGKIYGGTGNLISSTQRGAITFVYIDSTQGWITSSGLSQNPFLPAPPTVEYLIIAGGGGGSNGNDGGGGAGGYRTSASLSVSQGVSYTLTVGGGGAGAGPGASTVGSASSMSGPAPFTTISSAGGGSNSTGGSGAGGTSFGSGYAGNTPAIPGPAVQGYAGGNGNGGAAPGYTGGGGGGAGGVGSAGTSTTGGAGGPGSASTITGPSVTYAGGGGGASRNGAGFGGAAGSGGGGAGGGSSAQNGGAGTANTGGGGGAGGYSPPSAANGGNGGSGVIIIAYPSTYANIASIGAGLTSTLDTTTRSGYKVYTFTAGTGTISW